VSAFLAHPILPRGSDIAAPLPPASKIFSESAATPRQAACLARGAVGQNAYRTAVRRAGGGPPLRAGHALPSRHGRDASGPAWRRGAARLAAGPGRAAPRARARVRSPARAWPQAGLGRGQPGAASAAPGRRRSRAEGGECGAEGPGGTDSSASRVRRIPHRCRRLPAAWDGRISQASRSGCVWRYFPWRHDSW